MAQAAVQKKKLSQNIKVCVRVRPFSDEEQQYRTKNVVHCTSMREIKLKDKKFCFDRVFPPDSTQMEVYTFVVAPMITDVLSGYNCTVFAYGQTGTGKTHTMTGGDPNNISENWQADELAGCVPRAAAHIFNEIGSMNCLDYNVRVSFLELYNEEVRDLISEEEQNLPLSIYNDSKGSVFIQNLTEVSVFSSKDIYMILQKGLVKRETASTFMNNHSSRSHTVFTITVHRREITDSGEEVLKTGKINLVDLAGSENIARSGCKDKRALELANINRSLLTLGRVIQVLAERNHKHVPYRDSKLTRILQDSLGGHTKTCIIATVSPSHTSIEETQSTLDYASRARDIRNTPMINEKVTKAQMIKEMSDEIEKLKKDLSAARSGEGFFVSRDNWEIMQCELETNSSALNLKNDVIQDLKMKMSDLKTVQEIKKKEFEDVMNVCQKKVKAIDKAKAILKTLSQSLKEEQYLSQCYLEAAKQNNLEAEQMLEMNKHLAKNQEVLYKKLEKQYYYNSMNQNIIKEKHEVLSDGVHQVEKMIDSITSNFAENVDQYKNKVSNFKEEGLKYEYNFNNKLRTQVKSMLDSSLKKFHTQNNTIFDTCFREQESIEDKLQETRAILCNNNLAEETLRLYLERESRNEININSMVAKHEARIEKIRNRIKKKESDIEAVEKWSRMFIDHSREEVDELCDFVSELEDHIKTCHEITKSDESTHIISTIQGNLQAIYNMHTDINEGLQQVEDNIETAKHNLGTHQMNVIDNSEQLTKEITETHHAEFKGNMTFIKQQVSEVTALANVVDEMQHKIDGDLENVKKIVANFKEIRNDIHNRIVPVTRSGDTPKGSNLKRLSRKKDSAPSREVLLEKFRQEIDQDVADQTFNLDESCVSLDDALLNGSLKSSSSTENVDSALMKTPD